MARGSAAIDSLAYYGAVGLVTVIGYRMALEGRLGKDMQRSAVGVWEALHPGQRYGAARATATATAPPRQLPHERGARWPTSLRDMGGVPLAYDVDRDTLVQAVAGGNVYSPGDVVYGSLGDALQLQEAGRLVHVDSGAVLSVRDFVQGSE